jgi:exonuclease SbcC
LLSDAALAEAEEKRRVLDAEEATVRGLLGDPELVAAAELTAPDLDTVEAGLAAATDARTAAASERDRARVRHTRLVELGAELGERVAEWRPAAYRHAVATRMAELTSGKAAENRDHMKLSAYVLAARLEQVVAAANARLARMSGGRYLLEHTTDRTRGDLRKGGGGLGLKVVDTWTMRPREPATLSGGETFICSLALALGLADVVTAEAGGAEIATLFVDEGFGSLDADTLDEVMDVLDDLRDGGRAVGVVSHVAELRARITARLVVTKDRAGSTLAAAL